MPAQQNGSTELSGGAPAPASASRLEPLPLVASRSCAGRLVRLPPVRQPTMRRPQWHEAGAGGNDMPRFHDIKTSSNHQTRTVVSRTPAG
jgi:hypothetical protein